jgi:hypothetical protein
MESKKQFIKLARIEIALAKNGSLRNSVGDYFTTTHTTSFRVCAI